MDVLRQEILVRRPYAQLATNTRMHNSKMVVALAFDMLLIGP